jgi:hypothetical protein
MRRLARSQLGGSMRRSAKSSHAQARSAIATPNSRRAFSSTRQMPAAAS